MLLAVSMPAKQVQKAEGTEPKNWWTYRPPKSMTLDELQQLAASKLGTATASGFAAGVAHANSAPPVQASAGPAQQGSSLSAVVGNVTMALIQRWILAEVGLAAQQQLSQPNMATKSTPQVRAADYVPTDSVTTASNTDRDTLGAGQIPQVTAQVAADGADGPGTATVSNQQPVGSKNQDPGIKVDPSAVAQPGEEACRLRLLYHVVSMVREETWKQVLLKLQLHRMPGHCSAHCCHRSAAGLDDSCYTVDPYRQRAKLQFIAHILASTTTTDMHLLLTDIIVRTTGDSSSTRSDSSQNLQQPLPLAAAQQANTEPGVKEQRLVTALWNLDRIDQQQLPLNSTFSYGSSTAAGTGEAHPHNAGYVTELCTLGQDLWLAWSCWCVKRMLGGPSPLLQAANLEAPPCRERPAN